MKPMIKKLIATSVRFQFGLDDIISSNVLKYKNITLNHHLNFGVLVML